MQYLKKILKNISISCFVRSFSFNINILLVVCLYLFPNVQKYANIVPINLDNRKQKENGYKAKKMWDEFTDRV